jgi:hypothetical protein
MRDFTGLKKPIVMKYAAEDSISTHHHGQGKILEVLEEDELYVVRCDGDPTIMSDMDIKEGINSTFLAEVSKDGATYHYRFVRAFGVNSAAIKAGRYWRYVTIHDTIE